MGARVEAMRSVSRASGPSRPLAVSRRGEDAMVAQASRAAGAEPTPQRRAVEPLFRRPRLEPTSQRPTSEPALGARSRPAEATPVGRAAPKAPPFEWLDLELIPLGRKPDPRGYAVYAQRPQPAPAPVILIDVA
jgi:hypothetical protein